MLYTELTDALAENYNYTNLYSCNCDYSRYCVPQRTEKQVSYHGKPENSIRISDHWSWYSNIKKCKDKTYIQCLNVDLPEPKQRDSEKATRPIFAAAIAVFKDGAYHTVAGEIYDKESDKWSVDVPDSPELLRRVTEIISGYSANLLTSINV